MVEAVLFDFDGTLVDYIDSDIQSLRFLHEFTGAKVSFDDFLESAVSEIMRFHDLVDNREIDPLMMHEFRLKNTFARHKMPWNSDYIGIYRKELIKNSAPFDGIEKLLSDVRQKVKTGLVTNAYDGEEQRERIRSCGLEDYFDVIVVAGDLGMYKPVPSIFLHSLRCLKVEPGKSVYVGDSITHDVVGAHAAGMKTVLFGNGSKMDCSLADYAVTGVGELRNLLNRLATGLTDMGALH